MGEPFKNLKKWQSTTTRTFKTISNSFLVYALNSIFSLLTLTLAVQKLAEILLQRGVEIVRLNFLQFLQILLPKKIFLETNILYIIIIHN